MQFHIDGDTGETISGWIVPDNPAAVPRILIARSAGREVELKANVLRADLKSLGLHKTGMAGFHVDEKIIPDLAKVPDIEIRDADTRILIYRRFQPAHHLERKLFRFELQALPQTRIEASMTKHFAANYHAVERHSYDTLFSILNNQFAQSIYVCGRALFTRYNQLLRDRGFLVVTLLRDPCEELVERLLFVRYATSGQGPAFLADHLTGLEPLIELAKRIDFDDERSVQTAFHSLTESQRQALANPFLRVLACNFDEEPERRHVSIALEHLASMDLVGLRDRLDEFKSILREQLGVDVLGEAAINEVTLVPQIAASLAQFRPVRDLLALDLTFYAMAREAILRVLDKPATARASRR